MEKGEQEVRAHLEAVGVEYEIVPCDPALADTAAFCEAYGYELEDSANTIVIVGKSDPRKYVACVVLADTKIDVNGVVRRKLGVKRARSLTRTTTRDITGMAIGGVTVIGLPDDLLIWVDSRVMDRRQIILGGGSRSCKVLTPPALLLALPNVEVVDGLSL